MSPEHCKNIYVSFMIKGKFVLEDEMFSPISIVEWSIDHCSRVTLQTSRCISILNKDNIMIVYRPDRITTMDNNET